MSSGPSTCCFIADSLLPWLPGLCSAPREFQYRLLSPMYTKGHNLHSTLYTMPVTWFSCSHSLGFLNTSPSFFTSRKWSGFNISFTKNASNSFGNAFDIRDWGESCCPFWYFWSCIFLPLLLCLLNEFYSIPIGFQVTDHTLFFVEPLLCTWW